jgi:hypothetical protein
LGVAPSTQTTLAGPTRPIGVPEIPQVFLPSTGKKGTYSPTLYAAASVHFRDRKRKIDEVRQVAFTVPLTEGLKKIDWDTAQPCPVTPAQLLKEPPAAAAYLPLPSAAMQLQTFTRWAKHFDRWLARTQHLDVTVSGETPEALSLAPKRGGVSVEIVAIAWELV